MYLMRPTVFESAVDKACPRYGVGAVLAFLPIGPLGNFLYPYSASFDLVGAFYGAWGVLPGSSSNLYSVVGNAFWYGFLLFALLSIRYPRLSLAKAEPVLVSLALDGETTVRVV